MTRSAIMGHDANKPLCVLVNQCRAARRIGTAEQEQKQADANKVATSPPGKNQNRKDVSSNHGDLQNLE